MYFKFIPRMIEVVAEAGRVPFIWGDKGIGKSQVIAQFAKDNGLGFVDLRLGQMDVGDLIGLPRTREIPGKGFKTIMTCPEWFPTESDVESGLVKAKGFVFLDEFNRATTQDVIQAMFQFVLGYRDDDGSIRHNLHTHLLPKGWSIICAGNPDSGDYQVQTLDPAMLDRFIQIVARKDIKGAVRWMRDHLHNKEISEFVFKTPKAIGGTSQFPLDIDPTPRSYEMLDDILVVMEEEDFNNFGLEVIQGCIGKDMGTMLYNHLKDNLIRPIPGDVIMNTRNFDKLYEEQIKKFVEGDVKRVELLKVTVDDIQQAIEKKEPTQHQSKNIVNFINTLPSDQQIHIMKNLVRHKNCVNVFLELSDPKRDAELDNMFKSLGYDAKEVEEALSKLDEVIEQAKAEEEK